MPQPNTICKNPNCHNGEDGGRKHFVACTYCAKNSKSKQLWRAYCCSPECWDEYQEQVRIARSGGTPVDDVPERTDMTREEVVQLIEEMPDETVEELTREELSGYLAEDAELTPENISPALAVINAEMDAETSHRKNKKNR